MKILPPFSSDERTPAFPIGLVQEFVRLFVVRHTTTVPEQRALEEIPKPFYHNLLPPSACLPPALSARRMMAMLKSTKMSSMMASALPALQACSVINFM